MRFMIIVPLLLMPWGARAQSHSAPPVMPAGDPACVARVGGQCVLRSAHSIVQLILESGGMTAVLKNADASSQPKEFGIQEDLLARVARGEMSTDDAATVAGDLANFDGVVYSVPQLAQLADALGFTSDARFTENDLRELVRAHVQLTLGVSLVTASYLTQSLGLETFAKTPRNDSPTSPEIVLGLSDDPMLVKSIILEAHDSIEPAPMAQELPSDVNSSHN
jgi:hypothetical protein